MTVKAVIDTNIWVSALLKPCGPPASLRQLFEQGVFNVVISAPMLEELADVLSRPKIRTRYGITAEDIQDLLMLIEDRAEDVLLSDNIAVCRDKDDNCVLETAIKGLAEYLVTGDNDIKLDEEVLSFLSPYGVTVIPLSKFLDIMTQP